MSANRHIERILAFIHTVVWRFRSHLIVEVERFAQSVFVGQIDDIAVRARCQIGIEGEGDDRFLGRIEGTGTFIHRQPVCEGLDGILMALTGIVDDADGTLDRRHIRTVYCVRRNIPFLPFESVTVHERRPCDRRYHRVAVEVLHVAHGDIHLLLVNLAVTHVDVDHQLIVVKRPIELEFAQLSHILDRCTLGIILEGIDIRAVHETFDERLYFIDDVAFAGLEYALVVDGEDLLKDTALVLFHLAERQVGHQTHLIADRRNGTVGAHQRLRQGLLIDDKLVDIAVKAVTAEVHISAHFAKLRSVKGLRHKVIHIDGYVVIGAVDGEHEVVPVVIRHILRYLPRRRIAMQIEVSARYIDKRTLRCGGIGRLYPSCTEDLTVLRFGLEPEHERLVLLSGTAHEVAVHDHHLRIRHMERYTLLVLPSSAVEIEGSAVRLIGQRLALAFIHRIVRQQLALVAGEAYHIGLRHLVGRERLGPEANLFHLTVKAAAETKRRTRGVLNIDKGFRNGSRAIGQLVCADIEMRDTVILVKDEYHAAERRHRLFDRQGFQGDIVVGSLQTVIFRLTEGELAAVINLIDKERSLFVRIGREYEHIHGEGLVGYRTLYFGQGVGIIRTIEMERYARGDTGLVGITGHLEVIVLIEVVTGYRFVEPQCEVVSHTEDSVSGFRLSEHARRTGIFRSRQHGGRAGDEARTVTAERYGAQVVLLLHRVTLAVEAIVLYLAVLDHLLRAGCVLIEAVVCKIRAEIHPCVFGLRGLLVLQLDMVEVIIVDVKSIDADREIIALLVLRREGIHDPLVGRRGDIHRTTYRHIMHGEAGVLIRGQRRTFRGEDEAYILVVV